MIKWNLWARTILLTALVMALLIGNVVSFSPLHSIRSSVANGVNSNKAKATSFSVLALSANGRGPSSAAPSTMTNQIDWNAVVKYPVGLAHSAQQKKGNVGRLKQEDWEYNKRNKPSWTPPGVVFGIMWPLFTFGLRAATAAMIVQSSGGKYATQTLMSLMLHLGFGSLWNSVNNVENRLGVATIVLYGLWLSNAFAAFQFYQVNPMAGKLLALTQIWITAAAALETRTWQINPDPETGKREPLLPRQHPKWVTKFRWEQQ